jgi:hypothetical protein
MITKGSKMAVANVDQFPKTRAPIASLYRFHREAVDNVRLPGGAVMRFAEMAHDMARGMRTVASVLAADDQATQDADAPRLLAVDDREALIRVMYLNMDLMASQAGELMEWAYDCHTDKGRAEKAELQGSLARAGDT